MADITQLADDPLLKDPRFVRLQEILRTVWDLESIGKVLSWDRQTIMPAAAGEDRGRQVATLSRMRHEMFASDEVGRLLEELAGEVDLDSLGDVPSLIRVAKRDYARATKLPSEFVGRLSEATSRAHMSWRSAKENDDFAIFRDDLRRVVELTIEKAEVLGYERHRYDALLDQHEPDVRTETVSAAFDELKRELLPVLEAIKDRPPVDDSFLYREYDAKKLLDFGLELARAIGYDMGRGAVAYSPHPFTSAIAAGDVRITTWNNPDLKGPLMATVHEAGHAIHYQGVPARYARTPLWGSPGLGISESQSRLFEVIVGRSKPFWERFFPRAKHYFPDQLGDVTLEQFYRAINRVTPSLIRVEADELTYHLHIIIRFELEQALVAGSLSVDDLPEAWNERMAAYLGVVPEAPSKGVLQDIHWSGGNIGYFPTYSIGSILAAHLVETAVSRDPAIGDELARGEVDALRRWLTEHVYAYGRKLTPPRLIEAVTGGPFTVKPFMAYVKRKFGEIYGL